MEGEQGVIRKSFAVFQHVVAKEKQKKRKKFRANRFSDDDSSPSESELVIDDEFRNELPKKRTQAVRRIRFSEETLNLSCDWDSCGQIFSNNEKFYKHLIEHLRDIKEDFDCKWINCPVPKGSESVQMLMRHVSYHAYLSKLINIGENVLKRNNLPDCTYTPDYTIEVSANGYICEWEECLHRMNTVHDFYSHVACHILGTPSGKDRRVSVVVRCQWIGCTATFTTRYKLADHVRIHTKEKMIACPKCFGIFSNKTTFSDHRKRQLKTDLRSYQCSQCLKLFSSEKILSDHMRSHINHYKCTLCDMTSTKPSMLAKHYRYRHMNERPFSCQHCKKTFVAKCNLNTHLLTHQEKPFKCDKCEFACKSKVGLRNHLAKVHGMEKPSYECQVCKVLFERGDNLTRHLMKFHKFHWPSGHSRFRYMKDQDGICRLQTVRYESLEVTEEMIKSESMKPVVNSKAVTYNVTYDNNNKNGYVLTVSQEEGVENENTDNDCPTLTTSVDNTTGVTSGNSNIIITIEDLDQDGNVIKTEEIDAEEIISLGDNIIKKEDVVTTISGILIDPAEDYTRPDIKFTAITDHSDSTGNYQNGM